ncbi:MAG: hypothetical protein OS130_10035 [Thermodesulfobacteriota bacterium]|jgi:hypothetical protein|nr:MAG: hypothetical protein OS130_10035 [Thermodesulfobacteriota bacterium]
MSERLILQGALAEKKRKQIAIVTKADGIIRAIKIIIQPGAIRPFAELKTGEARQLIIELDDLHTEYVQLLDQIADIKRELGENA